METVYNLRSVTKKSNERLQKCYLQQIKNKTCNEINPRVCLEKLKVLENPGTYRFCLKNGQVKPLKPPHEKPWQENSLWMVAFVVFCLGLSLIYWKDDVKTYSDLIANADGKICIIIKNYILDLTKFWTKNVKKDYVAPKKKIDFSKENFLSLLMTNKKNDESSSESEYRNIVKSHLVKVKKSKRLKKSSVNFIEEQCKRGNKPVQHDNFMNGEDDSLNGDALGFSNLTDYALESQGAKILSIYDTEPYGVVTMKFLNYDFGAVQNYFVQKYFKTVGPSLILVPWSKPGDCWAFKGSHGRILIELSEKVVITAVAVDHIPKDLSLYGNINSAPKTFSIVGIEEFNDKGSSKIYLGKYQYAVPGPSSQTFSIKLKEKVHFRAIDLTIESNHGNKDYTCFYKIRVYGHK